MSKYTLRKYLLNKRVTLYEEISLYKDILLTDNFTEQDRNNLLIAEAELNIVKDIIKICETRKHF